MRDHVEEHYPALEFIVPRSEWSAAGGAPSPDVMIQNPRTRDRLAIEIKGGTSSNSVPSASISKLIEMNLFGTAPAGSAGRTRVWLVSSAFVPAPLKVSLAAEGIQFVQSESVDDALKSLDQPLRELASRS